MVCITCSSFEAFVFRKKYLTFAYGLASALITQVKYFLDFMCLTWDPSLRSLPPQDVFYISVFVLISPTRARLSRCADSAAGPLWETATVWNSLFPGAVISRLRTGQRCLNTLIPQPSFFPNFNRPPLLPLPPHNNYLCNVLHTSPKRARSAGDTR